MLRFHLATIMVDDYDRAINYYVGTLGFALVEDTDMGDDKRWVVVRPGPDGTGLQLAKATTRDRQPNGRPRGLLLAHRRL
jgi:catechol 2,3-dioxygenase-like lactoylglutathione lyase family enzyme